MKAYFDHERLEVYQAARKFNREIGRLLEEIPRGHTTSPGARPRSARPFWTSWWTTPCCLKSEPSDRKRSSAPSSP